MQEDFLSGVTSLVKEYQSTADGEAVLTNYLMWRVLCAFFPDHSTDCAQHRENCLKDTEVMFAPAVTAMYVRAKGVDKAHEVVRQVRDGPHAVGQKSFSCICVHRVPGRQDGDRHEGCFQEEPAPPLMDVAREFESGGG